MSCLVASSFGCGSSAEEPSGANGASGGEEALAAREPVRRYEGFSTPEGVLYDAAADVYLVSNIDGSPLEHDDRAFISRLSPDGSVLALRFIDSDAEGVTLNAPKGMAISGDQLFVADLDVVRVFHRETGAPIGEIEIPGATFLNAVAVGPNGKVYVTDSGLTAGPEGFVPSGTDAVYEVALGEEPVAIARGEELARPNGIVAVGDELFVVCFGGRDLLRLTTEGQIVERTALPAGSLDGLVALEGGDLLVSSWEASAVFRGSPSGGFEAVVEGVGSPAAIGFDTSRGLVLVPLFTENQVVVYALP